MTWQLHLLPNFTLLVVEYGSLLCLAMGTTKHQHFHILADLFSQYSWRISYTDPIPSSVKTVKNDEQRQNET
jgi:hypothetical protein